MSYPEAFANDVPRKDESVNTSIEYPTYSTLSLIPTIYVYL